MSIQQSKKQSDLEKRLKILRQQVYGKQEFKVQSALTRNASADEKFKLEDKISISGSKNPVPSSDATYLYRDLLKISLLSALALGTEGILFFLSQNHLLKLSF